MIYFLLAFAAVWPILLNTAAGVKALDARWLQLARSLSATRWETLRRVIVPGVLGHVLTGVRLAYSELMAMVLLIGGLGFCLDAAARSLYARWNHGASR